MRGVFKVAVDSASLPNQSKEGPERVCKSQHAFVCISHNHTKDGTISLQIQLLNTHIRFSEEAVERVEHITIEFPSFPFIAILTIKYSNSRRGTIEASKILKNSNNRFSFLNVKHGTM